MNYDRKYFCHIVLSEFERIRFTEACIVVADETRRFLQSLEDTTASDGRSLFEFAHHLRMGTLRDAAIRLLLDDDTWDIYVQCMDLAAQKEDAVASYDFPRAAQLRDQQYAQRARLKQLRPEPFVILPQHIVRLFQDLGFDGPIRKAP